jgi:hypothetical protein
LPVRQYDFTDLYNDLTGNKVLISAFHVAQACLKFATSETRNGRPFDSGPWPKFAKKNNLRDLVDGFTGTGMEFDGPAIANAIAGLKDADKPLAAWSIAQMISIALSWDFAAFEQYLPRPEHTLQDLDSFIIPVKGAKRLYGESADLSAKPGPDLNQYDPSAVGGLKLWCDDPLLHGKFKVTVDRACGAQFDAAIDAEEKLKIALIQPNRSLLELSVTMVSPESDRNPRFFGVGPRCAKAQTRKVIKGLKLAAAAGAGIALLPELVMTKAEVEKVAGELAAPGNIITHDASSHTLRVVVSGSYHHIELDSGRQIPRNSTQVHFPRERIQPRQHSKSGKFVYRAPQTFLEAWQRSPLIFHWPAVFALLKQILRHMVKKGHKEKPIEFREDVASTTEITLFAGAKYSVVVVICADLLNKTFRRVLETLQPSLVLVCNMTPKQGDFASAAHALILACQSTLVSVNNPAKWLQSGRMLAIPVPGGMAGLPVQDGNKRVIGAHVPCQKILIFDLKAQELQKYPC